MERDAEVLIVGGGIIGASIAYHLGKRGLGPVILLEQGGLGEGSTGRCLGGIRYQFSTEINIRFSRESLRFFQSCREALGIDPEFKQIGYLFLATSPRSEKILRENLPLLQGFDVPVELLGPKEIRSRWPYLQVTDVLCGSYCEKEGYAGPSEVLMGLISGARRSGCHIHENVALQGIQLENGRVAGARTSEGAIGCRWIVNAAGPFAASVGAMAGFEIPVTPLRRQVFTTSPSRQIPRDIPLIIDLERGWYIRGEGEGFVMAGPQDEKPSFNTSLDGDLEARMWASENALYRIPALEEVEIKGGWAGLYEISPDLHAILGEAPGVQGFICANGFSGHGFMHSPMVGKLVAEMICNGKASSLDISTLSPDRFREGRLIPEAMTAFRQQG